MTFVHPVLHDPYSCSTPFKPVVVGTEIFSPSSPLLFSRGLLSLSPIASVQFSRGVAASGNTAGKPLPPSRTQSLVRWGTKSKPVRRDQSRNLKRISEAKEFMIEPIRRHHEERLCNSRHVTNSFPSAASPIFCNIDRAFRHRDIISHSRFGQEHVLLRALQRHILFRTPSQDVSLKFT